MKNVNTVINAVGVLALLWLSYVAFQHEKNYRDDLAAQNQSNEMLAKVLSRFPGGPVATTVPDKSH